MNLHCRPIASEQARVLVEWILAKTVHCKLISDHSRTKPNAKSWCKYYNKHSIFETLLHCIGSIDLVSLFKITIFDLKYEKIKDFSI
jgi:hypothetical protein